jgi:hypothetical protein
VTWVGTGVGVTVVTAAVADGAVVAAVVAAAEPVLSCAVLAWVVPAAGVAVLAATVVVRLSSQDCTVAVASTPAPAAAPAAATCRADPFAALMAAQPPSVAANEADVSKTLTLLIAAARRLPVRVTFISGTILSRSFRVQLQRRTE